MQKLHVVLSCTARKRVSETGYPRLRSVGPAPVSDRVERWAALVSTAPCRHVAADLYAGEYWQTGMELASRADLAGQIRVSIVSAGLGLVGIRDEVPMYGATFAARHPDSVLAISGSTAHSQVRRQWWDGLTRAAILGHHRPHRLVDLLEHGSNAGVVICIGRTYVDAVAPDLIDLVDLLDDPRRVMIFAAGAPLADLEQCWVTVPGRLRLPLGGSLSSTSIRAATAVLAELGTSAPDAEKARDIVAALAANAGELPSFDRRRQGDDVVFEWILDHLADTPNGSKTAALRRFRNEGNACEQARFGRLFDDAREMAT
jgi:hypothetical protein